MIPVFTLKLNQKILPRLVTVGKYDGIHPCLTAATNGNKVFIHSPHHHSISTSTGSSSLSTRLTSLDSDINLLTIGQHITAVCAGNLDPSSSGDVLVVGSQTHILAYDVEKNAELFYNELSDGANAILMGNHLSSCEDTLAYVGGNCSIMGFDHEGQDKFWTVTGDNVHAMTFTDFNLDGRPELIVGSEDYDIRVFQDDELLTELSEADAIISLCSLGHNRFGFALANGIVGVYSGDQRVWRSKSKHYPLVVTSYDYNDDGVNELVTGWSSGKVDIKHPETGQVLYRDTFSSHVAGIVKADYRLDGKEELICCSVDGEVRGYLPPSSTQQSHPLSSDLLQELSQKKANLMTELKNFEITQRVGQSQDPQVEVSRIEETVGVIPATTQIKTELKAQTGDDKLQPHIALIVETTNKTPIRTVVVFCDGLFDGESYIVHPPSDKVTHKVEIPLFPDKDIIYDLDIKTYVGQAGSTQFHVFETTRTLVRFSLYVPCPLDTEPRPHGSVVFYVNERPERIKSWLENNFLYGIGQEMATQSPYLDVAYMSLRTNTPFFIKMEQDKTNKITLTTDDMDLAGDIIQCMADDLCIEDLTSTAEFPKHMADLKEILVKVDEFNKVRETLSAEMADHSSIIRNLVVRAEDARLMNEMKNMKMAYMQLYDLNKEIMRGYEIRRNNHLELIDCLKIVNQAVQKAARLRVGKPKTLCITCCRTAIKEMDHDALIKAILTGTK